VLNCGINIGTGRLDLALNILDEHDCLGDCGLVWVQLTGPLKTSQGRLPVPLSQGSDGVSHDQLVVFCHGYEFCLNQLSFRVIGIGLQGGSEQSQEPGEWPMADSITNRRIELTGLLEPALYVLQQIPGIAVLGIRIQNLSADTAG
jgi:hypothetical protein